MEPNVINSAVFSCMDAELILKAGTYYFDVSLINEAIFG
jgi:hypothetical protein